jgi:hypothetical protein
MIAINTETASRHILRACNLNDAWGFSRRYEIQGTGGYLSEPKELDTKVTQESIGSQLK